MFAQLIYRWTKQSARSFLTTEETFTRIISNRRSTKFHKFRPIFSLPKLSGIECKTSIFKNCAFRGAGYQIPAVPTTRDFTPRCFRKITETSCSKVKTHPGQRDTRRPPPNAVISYPGRSLYRTGHRASPIYYLLSVNDRRFVTLPSGRRCPARPHRHKSPIVVWRRLGAF